LIWLKAPAPPIRDKARINQFRNNRKPIGGHSVWDIAGAPARESIDAAPVAAF